MSQNKMGEVASILEAELISVKAANQRGLIIGVLIAVFVVGYLFWASVQFNKLLDPEGLALTFSGVAIEAVPQAGDNLETALVQGAPDAAQMAAQAMLDMIPTYREVLEAEMKPVIDEITHVLAGAAMNKMATAAAEGKVASTADVSQAGADAAVARLDGILAQALDEPLEVGGPTGRETIDATLEQLVVVDRGLKRVVSGRGDPQERELLLQWLNVVTQYDAMANEAAIHTQEHGE